MKQAVYAIATMDTKGAEIAFVAERLRAAGAEVRTVDVGTRAAPAVAADVCRETVAGALAATAAPQETLDKSDRAAAVTAMGVALRAFLLAEEHAGRVAGVLGIGGSGGTAIVTAAMRALPIGLPKLMVSTVASGNVGAYIDCSDITMMYSVVDVAGLNTVSRRVLTNAAHAMAGMVGHQAAAAASQPAVGMTMFGVTTPCVTMVRQALEAQGLDCLVFHATGSGGRALEKLVASGLIQGVLDITTTEVADEVVGGVFPAGPDRFDALVAKKIPCVVSLGALDMVNFGARETVPAAFRDRKLLEHNAQVTLMRTTAAENRQAARWLAGKLSRAGAPLVVLVPQGGISALDAPGQPFYDAEADAALFDELEKGLAAAEHCRIVRAPHHINDPEFAALLVATFADLMAARRSVD